MSKPGFVSGSVTPPGEEGQAAERPLARTRSFTRRGGRLNERQQSAWDELASTYVLDVPRGGPSTSVDPGFELDLEATFGRRAPLVVEIGSGRGEAVVAAALEHPERDFLALEVYQPAVASTLSRCSRAGVENVRIAVVNAVEALTLLLAPGSIDQLLIYFPDPWHKSRHHKRRLVNDAFADLAASRIRLGGELRLATDWEDYALQMRTVLDPHPAFSNRFDGWAPRQEIRPLTKFEQKGLAKGRTIRDLVYLRQGSDDHR